MWVCIPPGGQPLTTAANTLTPYPSGTDSVLQDMSLTVQLLLNKLSPALSTLQICKLCC